jgi:hypothetical protein
LKNYKNVHAFEVFRKISQIKDVHEFKVITDFEKVHEFKIISFFEIIMVF